jgi:LPS export ABC transporter permease LptG/LPS export ABC transporter permease LptF
MTRIIDRYVYRELLPPLGIGIAVFTFFLLIDRIYQLTNLVITKNVPFGLVMSLLVYLLPTFLSMTLPLALLVSVLLVCGRLAGDLEVAALKAAGISPLRLFRPFVVVSVLVTLAIGWLTIVLMPTSVAGFQRQLFRILQTRAVAAVRERTFTGAFGQFVVYVEEVTPSQVGLRGVLVSDERDPKMSRIILAREGRLLADDVNRRLTIRFLDGSITETQTGDQRPFRHTAFTLYDMTVPLEMPATGSSKDVKPERQLPLGPLLRTASELAAKGERSSPYWVEVHKRFALPVAAFVFVLVGFPLGIRTQRGGRSVALAAAFVIVVAYYVLFTSLEGLANSGRLPAGLAIWLPNLVFALLGLVFLRQALGAGGPAWLERARRLGAAVAAGESLRGWAARPGRPRRAHRPRASTFLIDRYLVREYVTFLSLGLLGAAVLYVMVDLLQTLDRYLRVKPPLVLILQHMLYDGPGEIYKGLPIIVLLATLFLFLTLSKNRELDALKAAGVSLYRTSMPVLITALVISVAAVVFQEVLLPELTARADEVDRVKIRGHTPRHLQRQSQIWYRSSDTRFIRMGLLDPADRSIDGLVVLDVDASYRLETRLDARKARWAPDGWQIADGVVRRFDAGQRVRAESFAQRSGVLEESLDDFTQVQKPPETMSFVELRSYVARLQESGRRVGKYLVQLHAKLSFPLVNLIMALVAIPFALVAPRSGGRAVAIGMAVVVGVGYWVVHSMALAFAQADLLPPLLAAWTANIVFAGIGAALFLNART